MSNPVIINGIEVYGPPGVGLPVVDEFGVSSTLLPPEFAPTPPVTPSPKQPLAPHPDYPPSYPPISVGRPTETGPRLVVPYVLQSEDSGVIVIPPTGDMLQNEFATNGEWGVVDWAQRANWTAAVDWSGISNLPSHLGTYWWVGNGPPGSIPNSRPGDLYLDNLTGDVYQLS